MTILEILVMVNLIAVIAGIILIIKNNVPVDTEKMKKELLSEILDRQSSAIITAQVEINNEIRATRTELTTTVQTMMKTFADSLATSQSQTAERQDVRLKELTEGVSKGQDLLKTDIAEKSGRKHFCTPEQCERNYHNAFKCTGQTI